MHQLEKKMPRTAYMVEEVAKLAKDLKMSILPVRCCVEGCWGYVAFNVVYYDQRDPIELPLCLEHKTQVDAAVLKKLAEEI